MNTTTALGFKTGKMRKNANIVKPLNDARCIDADDYIKCMENETFSVEEVFPFNYKDFNSTPFYADLRSGIAQSVKINPGAISTSAAQTQTLNMKLNPNMSYIIILTDPKMQFTSYNPEVIPRILLKYPENVGVVTLYLKVNQYNILLTINVIMQYSFSY